MTDVEIQLMKSEDVGYKLHKYYNDGEERDKKIPDVLDRLYDMQDEIEDNRKMLASKLVIDSRDTSVSNRLRMYNDSFKEVTEAIRKVEDSNATYFFVVGEAPYRAIEVLEVAEETLPITEAVAENGKVKMRNTGSTADVYIVPSLYTGAASRLISAEKYTLNDKLVIFNAEYVVTGGYYVGVADSVLERTFICKECGKAFTLPMHVIRNYERKGLDLPKRCYGCIQVRKAAKRAEEQNNVCKDGE